jgi:hypothetical protein
VTKTRYTGWELALDKGEAAVDGRGPSADYLPLVIAESAGADSAASGGFHMARAAEENTGPRAGDQHLAPTSADGRAIKGGGHRRRTRRTLEAAVAGRPLPTSWRNALRESRPLRG